MKDSQACDFDAKSRLLEVTANLPMVRQLTHYLTMVNVEPEYWAAAIDEHRKIIGRSELADIRLPAQFQRVSRQHAEIWLDKHGVRIRDLGSKTGTKVNDVWIQSHNACSVMMRDRIWLGGVELDVVEDTSTMAKVIAESGAARLVELIPDSDTHDDLIAGAPSSTRSRLIQLSQAELEVVLWMCRGHHDDADIAHFLHRSPHTVRTQVNSIFRKLDVRSRAELLSLLKRRGS